MQPLVPTMTPAPGDRLKRFVGDRIVFTLQDRGGQAAKPGWRAVLRTNLGRAALLRQEILQARTRGLPLAGASWRDIAMKEQDGGWALELPLAEVGFFRAKAYLVDARGWQSWPPGPDVGIAVHPNGYRTANTLYCAFPRMFGPTRTALSTLDPKLEAALPTWIKPLTRWCRPRASCATLSRSSRTLWACSAAGYCICCRSIPRPRHTRALAGSAARMPPWT